MTGSRMVETRLPNGIRVLTETIPGVRSAAVGVWVKQGSAHESPADMGASHLLEHMVFKGTRTRTPREIALALESLGGSLDAYTSREHTSYQARVLDEHLPEALEILSDIVLNPILRDEDLELEREVVLEEISTVDDTPDDLVFERHSQALWGDHPYGFSILGTRDTVGGMKAETLRDIHARRYRGGRLIIAAAGRLEHADVVDRVQRLFGELPETDPEEAREAPVPSENGDVKVVRDSMQSHIVFGTATPPRTDARRYPLILLSAAFGGGMSSRLFQKVREELALAYTVYSFQSFYALAGVSGVYAGTRPDWSDRAVEVIREEFARMARGGLTREELEQIKSQVKGQVMLSLESTGARLYRLAGFALYDQPFLSLDELLAVIDGVTWGETAEAAENFFDPERQVLLRLGPNGS
jgi:predicted Zn-dependent peptidase